MRQEVLLKVASLMIDKFEDNCILADMAKSANCTYSHACDIKNEFLIADIIQPTLETINENNKKFMLTDKGKLIQSNIGEIIRILDEVRQNGR